MVKIIKGSCSECQRKNLLILQSAKVCQRCLAEAFSNYAENLWEEEKQKLKEEHG